MSTRTIAEIERDMAFFAVNNENILPGEFENLFAELVEAADALRPTCPSCNGDEWMIEPHEGQDDGLHCGDCTDGRMSFEWMAAIVNSVYSEEWRDLYLTDAAVHATIYQLHSVRP